MLNSVMKMEGFSYTRIRSVPKADEILAMVRSVKF